MTIRIRSRDPDRRLLLNMELDRGTLLSSCQSGSLRGIKAHLITQRLVFLSQDVHQNAQGNLELVSERTWPRPGQA